jgi:Glyoxalase/Bleomycin resistance protein/Dioxygenase superfamily
MWPCQQPQSLHVAMPLRARSCPRPACSAAAFCKRSEAGPSCADAVHLGLIAIVVGDYDPAISFFLHVDDFDAAYARMTSAGVQFVTAPRTGPYGRVAVFLDIAGNKWDLIGPAS